MEFRNPLLKYILQLPYYIKIPFLHTQSDIKHIPVNIYNRTAILPSTNKFDHISLTATTTYCFISVSIPKNRLIDYSDSKNILNKTKPLLHTKLNVTFRSFVKMKTATSSGKNHKVPCIFHKMIITCIHLLHNKYADYGIQSICLLEMAQNVLRLFLMLKTFYYLLKTEKHDYKIKYPL